MPDRNEVSGPKELSMENDKFTKGKCFYECFQLSCKSFSN